MLSPSSAIRVFLAVEPVDMRGSYNSLSGLARRLGLDPLDGHLYVFLNRRRFMAALLGKLCIGPSGGRLRPTYMGRACSAYATFALSASA